MKINYKLCYDEKSKDVMDIINRLVLEYCDIYFHKATNIGDDERCENCGTYSDECLMNEIVVKYNKKTMFSFYICDDCAEKNNLLNK